MDEMPGRIELLYYQFGIDILDIQGERTTLIILHKIYNMRENLCQG